MHSRLRSPKRPSCRLLPASSFATPSCDVRLVDRNIKAAGLARAALTASEARAAVAIMAAALAAVWVAAAMAARGMRGARGRLSEGDQRGGADANGDGTAAGRLAAGEPDRPGRANRGAGG